MPRSGPRRAHAWPGLAPDTYILGGAFAAGGKAADWWAGAGGDDGAALLRREEGAPAGSAGVVFLPFLAGERAPLWDAEVRGAFLGLGFEHGPSHLARAVVESSGYALRLLAESVVQAGARIDELRVCGGQARSPLWNRVKADVTRLPVAVPRVVDAALMGVAVCAAVGVGWYPDVMAGSAAMVQVAERLEPDPDLAGVYTARFATYRAGYAALKTLPTPDA